jgi:hypothetical protein
MRSLGLLLLFWLSVCIAAYTLSCEEDWTLNQVDDQRVANRQGMFGQ